MTAHNRTEVPPAEITPTDLKAEIHDFKRQWPEGEIECERFDVTAERTSPSTAQAVFFPALQRGAVWWGGNSEWTDAKSMDQVIDRWLKDEMSI